jgi:DNA-binding transcriptional regulator GbsR (MarR family)
MRLRKETQRFVEQVGVALESLGAARNAGRLLAVLLVAEEPISLDAACLVLRASKASVSTNARWLEATGLLQRVSYPGDRKDYYQVSPGSFERLLSRRVSQMRDWVRLAESGLEAIERENLVAQARLEEMRDTYRILADELTAHVARLEDRRTTS